MLRSASDDLVCRQRTAAAGRRAVARPADRRVACRTPADGRQGVVQHRRLWCLHRPGRWRRGSELSAPDNGRCRADHRNRRRAWPEASSSPARADGPRRPAVRLLHAGCGHAGRGVPSPLAGRARHGGADPRRSQRRDGRPSVPLRRLRGHRRRYHTRLRGRFRRRHRSAVTAARRQVQSHWRGEVHRGRVPGRRAGRRHPPVDPRARQSPLHQHGACARRARSARRDLDARRGDGAVGGSVPSGRKSLPSPRRSPTPRAMRSA